VPIHTRKFKENILCDIIPMDIGHIMPGRPWKFNRNNLHKRHSNKINFQYDGHKHTLCPLTFEEVQEDAIKLKTKIEKEKKS